MEKEFLTKNDNFMKNGNPKLYLEDFYKSSQEYNFEDFKKDGYFKFIKQNILNDPKIKNNKKYFELKRFLVNNNSFGILGKILSIFTKDKKTAETMVATLMSNAFSTFDEKISTDLNYYNKLLNSNEIVAKLYNDDQLYNKIKEYQLNESQNDLFKIGFKDIEHYEYFENWIKINAIIIVNFANVGQKKLGKLLSQLFLIHYENKKLQKDLVTANIIIHESLLDNYLKEIETNIIEKIFEIINLLNFDELELSKIMVLCVSMMSEFGFTTEKKFKLKNLLPQNKSSQKFRLYISEEIVNNVARELKQLSFATISEKNNYKHVNNFKIRFANKNFIFSKKNLQYAQTVFKKEDKIDFLTTLLESYFKSKKISFNNYNNHAQIIKMATLSCLYPLKKSDSLKVFEGSKEIFELLCLKKAFDANENLFNKIQKILKFQENNKNAFFEETKLTSYKNFSNWQKLIEIVKAVFEDLNLNTKIAESTTIYYLLKMEIFSSENAKNVNNLFYDQNIQITNEQISKYQNELISSIEDTIRKEKSSLYVNYIRFITETFGKVYLSDNPPLSTSGKVGLGLTYIILLLWTLVILAPIFQVAVQAFNWYSTNASTSIGEGEIGKQGVFNFLQFAFSIQNFVFLFKETMFIKWLGNSVFIAIVTMFFIVVITSLIGYAFSRFRFKGKRVSLMIVMILQMIPIVSGFVVFYIMHQLLKQRFGISGQVMLIFVYIGSGIVGNVFVLKGYMDGISTDIDDAAKIDGCGNFTIFVKIMLPLTKPMLSIIALWSFIGPFGDAFFPLVLLTEKSQFTMAVGLQTLIAAPAGQIFAQGSFAAGSLLVAVPISILFIAVQGNITGGLSSGGVKE